MGQMRGDVQKEAGGGWCLLAGLVSPGVAAQPARGLGANRLPWTQAPAHMAGAFTQHHCLVGAALLPSWSLSRTTRLCLPFKDPGRQPSIKFCSYFQTSVPLPMLFPLPGVPFPLLPPNPLWVSRPP